MAQALFALGTKLLREGMRTSDESVYRVIEVAEKVHESQMRRTGQSDLDR